MIFVGIGLVIFVAFIAVGLMVGRKEGAIDQRLQTYAGQQRGSAEKAAGGEDNKQSFIVKTVDKAVAKRGFASGMAADLARADLKLTVGEFLILNFISILFFGLVMFLLGNTIFLAPVGMFGG
jgi:tight adherence protein B